MHPLSASYIIVVIHGGELIQVSTPLYDFTLSIYSLKLFFDWKAFYIVWLETIPMLLGNEISEAMCQTMVGSLV